jgi:adenylylsulfate kinase
MPTTFDIDRCVVPPCPRSAPGERTGASANRAEPPGEPKNAGTVYWFTGLSGAGKTTLGARFCDRLRAEGRTVVFLDGDRLREVFGGAAGHSRVERQRSAMRNARLCRLLSDQGVDVVCATISLFHVCQRWNREHLPHYREIYVRVPLDVLRRRDSKGLYAGALRGDVSNVWGVDLAIEEPEHPDVILANDGRLSPDEMVSWLWNAVWHQD